MLLTEVLTNIQCLYSTIIYTLQGTLGRHQSVVLTYVHTILFYKHFTYLFMGNKGHREEIQQFPTQLIICFLLFQGSITTVCRDYSI